MLRGPACCLLRYPRGMQRLETAGGLRGFVWAMKSMLNPRDMMRVCLSGAWEDVVGRQGGCGGRSSTCRQSKRSRLFTPGRPLERPDLDRSAHSLLNERLRHGWKDDLVLGSRDYEVAWLASA